MNVKKFVRGTILTVMCIAGMLYLNSSVSKAYWVVVSNNNTNVRNSASTSSEVMTVVNAGDRLDVYSQENDSEGNTWFKVTINNASGYVRSDTVKKEEEATEASLTTTAQVEPVVSDSVESIPSQAATVNKDNVNVRSSASTNGSVVTKLQEGAAVTLTGTTSDQEGKTWYQVNFINNGSNVTGYIREDFVEPGEVVADVQDGEGTGAEGGEDELADLYGDIPTEDGTTASNDEYGLFFEADQDGVDCWYIHDNVAQKRYKLEQLMQADEMNTNNLEIKNKEIGKMRIAVIVLAVLFVFALLAAGFFGFKYHDLKDDDDDEDDDDEDDDDDFREAPPVRRRQRPETEPRGRGREVDRSEERSTRQAARRPETVPQRRPASGGQRRAETEGRTMQRSSEVRRPAAEIQRRPSQGGTRTGSSAPARQARRAPVSESASARSASRGDLEWKSKNFLTRDEDEVSFIDMDGDI